MVWAMKNLNPPEVYAINCIEIKMIDPMVRTFTQKENLL
jgi:hypothetical protein